MVFTIEFRISSLFFWDYVVIDWAMRSHLTEYEITHMLKVIVRKWNQPLCALLKMQTFLKIIPQLFTWFKHIHFTTIGSHMYNDYPLMWDKLFTWNLALGTALFIMFMVFNQISDQVAWYSMNNEMLSKMQSTLWEASRNSACYKLHRINRKLSWRLGNIFRYIWSLCDLSFNDFNYDVWDLPQWEL